MHRYRLTHTTEFNYDGPVSESYNEVRLRPLQDDLQSCLSFRLTTDPASTAAMHIDYYGNYVHRFNIMDEHRRLRIQADSVALVQTPLPVPDETRSLEQLAQSQDLDEHYDFLTPTAYVPHQPELRGILQQAEEDSGGSCGRFALAAMRIVHTSFRYEKGATHVQSSLGDTLATGVGVCQDFAHILLGVVRMRGLPGRYVSGYLVPKGTAEPGGSMEDVIGGQASHAWMEVFLPGQGWYGLDPTLGTPVTVQHVRVAYGRDYGDAAPARGVYKGHAGQRLSVDVRVRPALDDEGREHLQESSAAPAAQSAEAPAHQQQQ